jgi:hypothetical protein
MKENKFVVDLDGIQLTHDQRKKLLEGLHRVVVKKIKTKKVAGKNEMNFFKNKPKMLVSTTDLFTGESLLSSTVNIDVTFFNGGDADTLTVSLDRLDGSHEEKTVDFHGGTIQFANISSEDTIGLDGFCVSKAVMTIDVPVKQNLPSSFPGGHIFLILIIK